MIRFWIKRKKRADERYHRASLWLSPMIDKVMKDKEPYLDADFCLDRLCKMVGSNRSYVSYALKEKNTNFLKMVRDYRCRYVEKLVRGKPHSYDLDDIAYISGFPSKRAMLKSLRHHYFRIYIMVRMSIKK